MLLNLEKCSEKVLLVKVVVLLVLLVLVDTKVMLVLVAD